MAEVYEREAPDEQFRRPEKWPNDRLSKYLANAIECFYYTYNAHRAEVRRFNTGLELFFEGGDALSHFRRRYGGDDSTLRGFDGARRFLSACRSELVAAATLIWSHQPYAASKPLRGALEAALYGYHVYHDPNAWNRWAERPRTDDLAGDQARRQRNAVGREFSATSIARELRGTADRLANDIMTMYEELIDRGAHLNFTAYTGSTKRAEEGRYLVEWHTSIGATDAQIRKSLKDINRVTALSLRLFDRVFEQHWRPVGLSSKIGSFGYRTR